MKLRGENFDDRVSYKTIGFEGRTYLEHVFRAMVAIGGPLPPSAVVHHVDGNKHNNKNTNLVICQDKKYHALLHRRQFVVDCGGDPNTQKACSACRSVRSIDDPYCESCYKDRNQKEQEEILLHACTLPWQVRERIFEYRNLDWPDFDRLEVQNQIRRWSNEASEMAEEWFMSKEKTYSCLVPKCRWIIKSSEQTTSAVGSRGLCGFHYGLAARLVRSGKTTWPQLEANGKCRESRLWEVKDPDAKEWFLDDSEIMPELEQEEITQ